MIFDLQGRDLGSKVITETVANGNIKKALHENDIPFCFLLNWQ
jgi:hypothetical protein